MKSIRHGQRPAIGASSCTKAMSGIGNTRTSPKQTRILKLLERNGRWISPLLGVQQRSSSCDDVEQSSPHPWCSAAKFFSLAWCSAAVKLFPSSASQHSDDDNVFLLLFNYV
jgi:hypothetical protein